VLKDTELCISSLSGTGGNLPICSLLGEMGACGASKVYLVLLVFCWVFTEGLLTEESCYDDSDFLETVDLVVPIADFLVLLAFLTIASGLKGSILSSFSSFNCDLSITFCFSY